MSQDIIPKNVIYAVNFGLNVSLSKHLKFSEECLLKREGVPDVEDFLTASFLTCQSILLPQQGSCVGSPGGHTTDRAEHGAEALKLPQHREQDLEKCLSRLSSTEILGGKQCKGVWGWGGKPGTQKRNSGFKRTSKRRTRKIIQTINYSPQPNPDVSLQPCSSRCMESLVNYI